MQVPTGGKAEITSVGDAVILKNYKLENVLHVPDFKFNLLLVSKITKQLSCVALFFPDFYVFQGLFNRKSLRIGKERKGLYIVQEVMKPAVGASVHKEDSSRRLWHPGLGHPAIGAMQRIANFKNKVYISTLECGELCPLAKQSRLKFPSTSSV